MVLVFALLLAACGPAGQPDADDSQPDEPAGTADTDEVTQVVVGSPQEPNTILPHFDLLDAAHEVMQLAYDCLYVVNEEGEYVPQLATEVPTVENGLASEDGRSYTIPFREGVEWQDGEPVTSADLKYTWEVITDEDLPIPSRTGWEDIESIETPDDHTAVVHFAEPNVSLLGTLSASSCALLPEHALADEDLVNSEQNRQPLGNGPYQVEEWQAGSHIRLVRNDNYWQEGKPHFDEVVYRIIPGTEGMRAAVERGDIDVQLYPGVSDQEFIRDVEGYELAEAPTYSWWFFWLNNEYEPLTDVRVRRALVHAIDKQTIADSVFRGNVEPMWAALPPNHWAHNPDVTPYPHEPERAAELLDEAGWTMGDDGLRQQDGETLSLEILNIAGEQERLQVIQIVQEYWQEIGVDVDIREVDAASFPPTMGEGDYEVAYGRFGEEHEPTFSLWLGTNWQRYGNQEALDLLDQAMVTPDRSERRDLIMEFQEQAAEDQPVIFLVPRATYSGHSTDLEGFKPSLTGSLWNAADWR